MTGGGAGAEEEVRVSEFNPFHQIPVGTLVTMEEFQ